MRIIFARHGESTANRCREIANRGLRHGLTAAGREQARALARRLESERITHIYASPILRAVETCIVVAHHLGLDYEITDALREYDCGILEGRSDEAAWQLWQAQFEAWNAGQGWDQGLEGGESFADIRARFVPFIDNLIARHGDSDAAILCVAHGGIYWMMLPLVLKNIDTAFIKQHGLAYTNCIVTECRDAGLRCLDWNGQPTP